MRVTRRVPLSLVGVSCHTQVLSGLVHSSQLLISKESTLRALRAVGGGDGDMGTHCPTSRCCRLGTMVVALGRPRLSSRSLLYHPARRQPTCTSQGHTASARASIVIALVDLYWERGRSVSPGRDMSTSAGVAPQ